MCSNTCKLCPRLVLSQAVTFANNTLTINLPAGTYTDREKYCIVIAQTIPAAATISAPVVITIGTGTATYPLLTAGCAPATAADVRTRTKYSTRLVTSASGASFRMLGCTSRACATPTLSTIDGGAAAATNAAVNAVATLWAGD